MLNPNQLEPERYELFIGPAYQFTPDRRDFFKILGGGIVILLMLPNHATAQESGSGGRRGGGAALPKEAAAWMHIGDDGMVKFFTGKVEVGQNSRTSLTQAISEETSPKGPPSSTHSIECNAKGESQKSLHPFLILLNPRVA